MKRWPVLALLPCVLVLAPLAQAQHAAARPAPALMPGLAPASPEQMEAAERVYYGVHDCADGLDLDVALDPQWPGYVDVRHGRITYVMKPVLSSTGAVRLEDVKGSVLLLQITAKSMLMDVQAGHRLADDCISERHRQATHEAAQAVQPALLLVDPAR